MCWSPCHLLVSEGRDSQPPGTWRSPPAPTVVVIPGPGSFFCSQVATVYKSVSCFLWREGMPSDEQRAWGISPSKATQRPNCGPWAIGGGMGRVTWETAMSASLISHCICQPTPHTDSDGKETVWGTQGSHSNPPTTGETLKPWPGPNVVNFSMLSLPVPEHLLPPFLFPQYATLERGAPGRTGWGQMGARPQAEDFSDTAERRQPGCEGHVT